MNAARAPKPPRRRRLLRVGAASGIGLLLLLYWALGTQAGARWLVPRVMHLSTSHIQIREVSGRIAGPLELSGVRYRSVGREGVEARIAHASLDVALPELLSRRLHVSMLELRGVELWLPDHHGTASRKQRDEQAASAWPTPPIDIVLDRLDLRDVRIHGGSLEPMVIRSAYAVGRWTRAHGIVIDRLAVESSAGRAHLEGAIDVRGSGHARGDIRWQAAGQSFSGDVVAVRDQRQLMLQAVMSSPFRAQLDATLNETPAGPWTFSLAVPTFDPRKKLHADSPLEAFAATLEGEGGPTMATVGGSVTINGQQMRVEPLRVEREGQVLRVDELTLIDPAGHGTLTATGTLHLAGAAATTDADAKGAAPYVDLMAHWHDVVLPEQWVGQPIATQGMLEVTGTPSLFTVNGQLSAGPPGYPSDISLLIAGTLEEIQVKHLAVEQRTGSLNLTGTLRHKPAMSWQLSARARHFDPGSLFVDWPGEIDFSLDTRGRMTPQGPSGSFELERLAGTLRGRRLAGQAALTVREDRILAGQLRLRAGKSELHLSGHDADATDLDATIKIAALEDWIARGAGRIQGRFHITGRFPQLAIAGRAQGRNVRLGEHSVRSIDVTTRVQDVSSTTGAVIVTASEIAGAGFAISTARLEFSGSGPNHTVQLNLTGELLTAQLRAHGTREGGGWFGTVDRLSLSLADFDALTLRQPMDVYWSPRRFGVSESCLVNSATTACIAANRNEAGELDVRYRLEKLPFGLITALALPATAPRIDGAVDGKGSIRRTSDGALFGNAQITSNSGRISDRGLAGQIEIAHTVLTYEHLKGAAQFAGKGARASIESSLGGGGVLTGRVAFENLGDSLARVAGDAKLVMPDLAPAAWLVPQLEELHGRGEGSLTIEGPLTDPEVIGNVSLRELAAEVPQAGINLKNGELDVSMNPDTGTTVRGKVESGDGEITLTSSTHADGRFEVKVHGQDFVALDLPVAQLTLGPDLVVARSAAGVMLSGTVTVPRAHVELANLPTQWNVVQVSPDVVVVDDEQPQQRERRTPTSADIRIVLGNDVRAYGRGLEASVRGQLDVRARDNRPTTAQGDLYLTGTYESAGPDFTIDHGRLRFDGGEITDPQVSFTATRTTGSVTVTLNVTGTAQAPVVEVSSDPPMSETQALAYLMVGKPLTELTSGEDDMVEVAARSLGTAAGNLLATAIGTRLGISDLRIEENPQIGGSTLTIGQYFSPRLYLSYGAGLFQPGHIMTMRFHLTERLSIKAVQGPNSQKAGISWRTER